MRLSWVVRVYLSACLLLISTSFASAQIINASADQQAPIPGAGHDYIHMLTETVNPADGSLSVRIQVPIPKGRGLTLPFSFAYDSNGIHYPLNGSTGLPLWATDSIPGYEQGGWRYTAPYLDAQPISLPPPACTYFIDYMLLTPSGERHALGLSAWQYYGYCSTNQYAPGQYLTGGDDYFQATSAPSNAVTVADADGTVYRFSGPWGFASSVEDRNGNEVTLSATQGSPYGFTMTDTAGRMVVSASSFGRSTGDTISVSGLSSPYTVHWGTAPYNYTPGWKLAAGAGYCANMVYANGSVPVATSIMLPNGEYYQFYYDSTYGLLDEIMFPSGGWVKYTWGVNSLSVFAWLAANNGTIACGYEYGQPAVLERQVSYDGTNVAQEQTFSYSTTWSGTVGLWSSKATNVTTTDELRSASFTTAYSYSPVDVWAQPSSGSPITSTQVPAESLITYDDWSGSTLRTVAKSWQDPYLMTCESTTQGSQTTRTDYAYADYGAASAYLSVPTVALMTDKKEWDWGQAPACGSASGGTPRRETQTAYQALGKTLTYTYAPSILDRPVTVTTYGNGSQAAQTQYAYDGTSVTGAGVAVGRDSAYNGNTTVPRGNATSKTEWLSGGSSPVTNYAYDDTGQMTSMKDPNSSTTTYAYSDYNTYLSQITYPNTGFAHVVKFSYGSADGQLASSTDQNNNTTTYSYSDSLDRLTQINYPDGGQTTYSYDDSPPTPSVTTTKEISSGQNYVSTSIMDGVGHVTRTELTSDPQGTDTTDSTYDGEGLVWKQSNPYRSTSDPSYGLTTTAYDAVGRVTSITRPDGNIASTSYSANCSTATDEQGKARETCSDGLGRLTDVYEDPSGLNVHTQYSYDALDNLTASVDGGQTRSFGYDSLSRLTSASNPESGTTTYTYDANGNVQTRKDARSVTTTYSYDALNRVLSKSYSDGTPVANFWYDNNYAAFGNWSVSGMTNTYGRLFATCTSSAIASCPGGYTGTVYSYDSMGRVVSHWQCTPYNCGSSAWQSTYTYDLAGDVQTWNHPAGYTITNAINNAQRITQIRSSLIDSTHPQYLAQSITYTAWGAEQTLENGCAGSGCTDTVETYAYNNRLQPVMIELGTSSNASADYCLAYNYYSSLGSPGACATPSQGTGDNGNVMGYLYQDSVNSSFSHAATYAYDSLNRLSTAAATGNSTYNLTFSYDRYGNMTCTVNGSTQGLCPQYSFNQSTNQISNSGFTYDAAGDLTSDGSYTYQWDAEGRLGTIVYYNAFTYDALGQRVASLGGLQYLHDPSGKIIGHYSSGGYWYQSFPVAGRRRAWYFNGSTYFYHLDNVGTVTGITGVDGSLQGDARYYPWGQDWLSAGGAMASSGPMFGSFTDWDGYVDESLYAGQHRNYPAGLGRWFSPDPAGTSAVDLGNPQSWNPYSYAGNNPTTNTDPSGLDYNVCTNDEIGSQTCTRVTNDTAFRQALANPGAGISTTYNAKTNSGNIYATGANGQQQLVGTYQWEPPTAQEEAAIGNNGTFFGAATLLAGGGLGIVRDVGEAAAGGIEEAGAAIDRLVGSEEPTGVSSDYTDVTKPSSLLPNRLTNVTAQQFGENLEAEGFKKSVQGEVTIYSKGGTQYTVYRAASTGGPSAQVRVGGKVVATIRLQQ